jgi:DNA-binding IscR family transcriptional regulator
VECLSGTPVEKCKFAGNCVFLPMWEEARQAVAGVYDNTRFADLVERDRQMASEYVPSYAI